MSLKLATRFHEIYERLAPAFGYETRKETRAFDPTTPNGRLMIAVTDQIEAEKLIELEAVRKELVLHRDLFGAIATALIAAGWRDDEILRRVKEAAKAP